MVMYVQLTQWTDIMQYVALQCFKVGIAQCTSKSLFLLPAIKRNGYRVVQNMLFAYKNLDFLC